MPFSLWDNFRTGNFRFPSPFKVSKLSEDICLRCSFILFWVAPGSQVAFLLHLFFFPKKFDDVSSPLFIDPPPRSFQVFESFQKLNFLKSVLYFPKSCSFLPCWLTWIHLVFRQAALSCVLAESLVYELFIFYYYEN